jgi:hypothetical protein
MMRLGDHSREELDRIGKQLACLLEERIDVHELARLALHLVEQAVDLGAVPKEPRVRTALFRWKHRQEGKPWSENVRGIPETDPALITFQRIVNALYPDLRDTRELDKNEKKERRRRRFPLARVAKSDLQWFIDFHKAVRRLAELLMETAATGNLHSAAKRTVVVMPQWDATTEARNKWIYQQAMEGVPWGEIVRKLRTKSRNWETLGSVNGVKKAADAYAAWRHLEPPPPRRAGRPKGRKSAPKYAPESGAF